MSVSTIGADTSAAWTTYRFNPNPPAQPPGFKQFDDSTSATGGAASTSASVNDGRARIGADLNSLLLDLQGGSATSGDATTAAASSGATSTAPTDGTAAGNLSSDLQTFFNDLSATGGAQGSGTGNGTGQVHHHHHHGPPPSPPSDTAQATADNSGATAGTPASGTDASSSSGDLLGFMVKALQSYGAVSTSTASPAAVALSA